MFRVANPRGFQSLEYTPMSLQVFELMADYGNLQCNESNYVDQIQIIVKNVGEENTGDDW